MLESRRGALVFRALVLTGTLCAPAIATAQSGGSAGTRAVVAPSLDIFYDSNVIRLGEQRTSGATDDVRVTPGLTFSLQRQFGRNSVTVDGLAAYDFYRRYDRLERARLNVGVSAGLGLLARCSLSPAARIQVRQAELEDLGVLVGSTSKTLDASLDATCRRPAGFYPVASLAATRRTNTGFRNLLDRENWTATGGIGYARPSLGEIQLFVSADQSRRPRRILADGRADGIDVVAFGLQFDRAVTPRFTTRASVSATSAKSRRPGVPDFNGVSYALALRILPTPRLVISPSVSRQVNSSLNTSSTYAISRDTSVDFDYALGARTGLIAGLGRIHRSYRGEDPLITGQPRLSDDTDFVQGGVRYDYRQYRLLLQASRRERNSENDFYDFASTRVQLSARARF